MNFSILYPILLFAFIFFCFRVVINKRGESRRRYLEQLLDDEQASNFSRAKPIPDHVYVQLNTDFLHDPALTDYPADLADHVKTTLETMRTNALQKSKQPMMKIEKDQTNTMLKEAFGVANLEKIIAGDENLYNYLHSLNNYAELLIKSHMKPAATLVLQHAVHELGSEITKSHELLKSL